MDQAWAQCVGNLKAGRSPYQLAVRQTQVLYVCRFFQLVYRVTLVQGTEILCKDFCLVCTSQWLWLCY